MATEGKNKYRERAAGKNDEYVVDCSTLALAKIAMKDKLVETGKAEKGLSIDIANGKDLMEGNVQGIRVFTGGKTKKNSNVRE